MLDDNPVLKERLMAAGAFAGIGLFAIAAVDVMVTGGFDFGPGRAPQTREQPSAYVRVVDAAQYVSDRFREISWDEPLFVGDANAATDEDLAGGDDGLPPPETFAEASGDDLYREVAALYTESEDGYRDEPTYEDAPAIDTETQYAEPAYLDEPTDDGFSPEEAEKLAIASGNG